MGMYQRKLCVILLEKKTKSVWLVGCEKKLRCCSISITRGLPRAYELTQYKIEKIHIPLDVVYVNLEDIKVES